MRIFPVTLIFQFFSFICFSQAFQVNLQGQKQQAMGSAGTALVQDAAIIFFNPGALSALSQNHSVIVSGNATLANTAFQEEATKQISRTNSPVGTPFSIYAAFSLKNNTDTTVGSSNLKLGLGIYTPFGSAVSWESSWTGRFALTSIKLQSIFFQPTISYRINKNLSVGAGFVYANGSVQLKKDLPVMNQNSEYGTATLDGKAQGFGFNAGLYFKPTDKISFGLTYRSAIQMKVDQGEATFVVPSSLTANFPNGKFSAALPLPSVLTLGVAYQPNTKWAFALDVNYGGWKSYEALEFDYENNTSSLKDTYSARNYKNNFAFRSGLQYAKDEKTFLRAGLGYVLSPVPDGYVTPETPDANRINYTAGFGYLLHKKIRLDASLTYANPTRKDKNLETNLEGTYKTMVFIPGLSLQYNF